ncbi:MAG: class I SAM-dependent methyltransferase [Vicinamibacteraceae bacterium]
MLDASQLASLDFGQGHACTPEEYLFLGALVRLIAPRSIVEIGTSTGIGTLVMAAALADVGGESLITIDLPLGRATFGDGLARNRAAVERLVPSLAGLVDYRIGASHTVLATLAATGHQADLVFIDGGHTEAVVRGDWERALALRPHTIVLHDTVHLADVARLVDELSATYPGITLTYPRRVAPGVEATQSGPAADQPPRHGPGLTIFTSLEVVSQARAASARPAVPAIHEVATALVHDGVLRPAELRQIVPGLRAGAPPARLRELEIVLSGRNDDYGGEDFHERMLVVAAFNHARLSEAGVSHRFTLVEWNPPEGRATLADRLRERLPWWPRSFVVSPAWHAWYSENPRLQFMEFFAKNAGIRRATADWVLTTNSDVFLSREIVERLAQGRLEPGTLYRASRLDLDRAMPRDGVTWDRLEDPRWLLRRFDPEPPYMSEAAGDFLLLDRETYHRIGGFNERVRFSKIDIDGQFGLQAHHRGLAIESLGRVYHIDHDGSFINSKHTYAADFSDAPFGPRWDWWQPYWNREDWGVRGAIDDVQGATTWLRTPEEAGPTLSLLLHGRGDPAARAAAIAGLLASPAAIEIVVVDPSAALADALGRHAGEPRLRVLGPPDVAPDGALGEAMSVAVWCAHGRHVVLLPGPVAIDGLDVLMRALEAPDLDRRAPHVHVVEAPDAADAALTVVSRRAVDRLGGLDELAGDVGEDLALRARRAFGATVVAGVTIRRMASTDGLRLYDPRLGAMWNAAGDGGMLPAALVADFAAKGERLTRHVEARLVRELPTDAHDVAVWGVGPLTPVAVAALRALGRHVVGIYAPEGNGGTACAGLTIRAAGDLDTSRGLWVVSACASPADVRHLLTHVPIAHVVHLADPTALRPATPPLTLAPAFEGLAHARACRTRGQFEAAEAAYAAVLRDPGFADAAIARYELALVHEQQGRLRDAEVGLRWLLRHWPEGRAMVAYNLGSLYERLERWAKARRAFEHALRLLRPDDAARVGGCRFHLGEIALAMGEDADARESFTRALEALPAHGKARTRLDELAARLLS